MMGKKYRLERPVRAVYTNHGIKGFLLLPQGAVLIVGSYRDNSRILEVKWEEKELFVFTQDVLERGTESKD